MRVGHAIEEGEDTHFQTDLPNLLIRPTRIPHRLYIRVLRFGGIERLQLDEFQQRKVCVRKGDVFGILDVAGSNRIHKRLVSAELPQRGSMRTHSKLALVERGHVSRHHFMLAPLEKAVAEMYLRHDVEHLVSVRAQRHGLHNAGNAPV